MVGLSASQQYILHLAQTHLDFLAMSTASHLNDGFVSRKRRATSDPLPTHSKKVKGTSGKDTELAFSDASERELAQMDSVPPPFSHLLSRF